MVERVGNDEVELQAYSAEELGQELSLSARAIRLYRVMDLLSPPQQPNSEKFSRCDRARLKFIVLCKNAGFSLVQIKEILRLGDEDGTLCQTALEKFQDQIDVLGRHILDKSKLLQELEEHFNMLERLQRAHDGMA